MQASANIPRASSPDFFVAPGLESVALDDKLRALAVWMLIRRTSPGPSTVIPPPGHLDAALQQRMPGLDAKTRDLLIATKVPLDPHAWRGVQECVAPLPAALVEDDVELARYFDQFGDTTGLLARRPTILRWMIELAELEPKMSVLDLSMGSAELLLACWRDNPLLELGGVEAERGKRLLGVARTILAGCRLQHVQARDPLDAPLADERWGIADAAKKWDRVLLVPPWGRRLSARQRDLLPITSNSAESGLLQHALGLVRPGGRVVMMANNGLLDRSVDARLRRLLLEKYRVCTVLSLPRGSFVPETQVEASILVIERSDPLPWVEFRTRTAATDHVVTRHAQTRELIAEGSVLHAYGKGERYFEFLSRLAGPTTLTLERVAEVMSGITVNFRHGLPDCLVEEARSRCPQHVIGVVRISEMRDGAVRRPEHHHLLLSPPDKKRLRAGDVLVARKTSIGKVTVVTQDMLDLVPGDALVCIRPDPRRLSSEFLATLLRGPCYQDWIHHVAPSTLPNLKRMRTQEFEELRVPVPPLAEQRWMVEQSAGSGARLEEMLL